VAKVVSHYSERSKNFFVKILFCSCILAQSARFLAATAVIWKREKKRIKGKEKTKKVGKRRKNEKKVQKSAQNYTIFFNSDMGVKMGSF
jgi:hypothetical protein